MEILQVFVTMFSKSSAADLLYVGKLQNYLKIKKTESGNDLKVLSFKLVAMFFVECHIRNSLL